MTLCECGCGETTNIGVRSKKPNRFIIGHDKKGKKCSTETRKKLSKSQKGRKCSPETRAKMSKAQKNRIFSTEHKLNMSKSHIGLKLSTETKKKLSKANSGENCSLETRAKISKAKKGRKLSSEHIAKLVGRKCSVETKTKMSKANMGKKLSPEHRAKLSKALKGENSYFYIDGRSGKQKYCWKFSTSLKRKVSDNFNNTCIECGKLESDCKTKLCIHHVNYDKNTCCEGEESIISPLFVPLCRSCHGKTNNKSKRDFYEEKYTKLIMEKYDGICF